MTPTTNDVEPTTSATDELRRLLDERGVEWWQSANTLGCIFTRWYSPIFGDEVVAMENGKEGLVLFDHFMTAEQAVAATLGSCNVGRYVGLRQGEYWERTENSNYYCGGCGWKVTDHDSYCPECGGALHNATLGSCNCSNNCTNGERTNAACNPITYDNGYSTDHLEPGEYHEFWEPACACGNCGELIPMRKFCPNCGCRLEVDV